MTPSTTPSTSRRTPATPSGTADVYVNTFDTAIPADATGTWTFTADVYRTVDHRRRLRPSGLEVREAALNPIFHVAVTDAEAEPRREVVAMAKCNRCHDVLALHGGQRFKCEECVICHNPNGSDEPERPDEELPPESIQMARMIHRIHTGEELATDYTIYGRNGSSTTTTRSATPATAATARACHAAGTYDVPLPEGTAEVPTPRDWYSPHAADRGRLPRLPRTVDAAAHAYVNTAPFGEACAACHGERRRVLGGQGSRSLATMEDPRPRSGAAAPRERWIGMRHLIRTLAIVALLPLCLPAVAAIAQDSADPSEACAACHEEVVAAVQDHDPRRRRARRPELRHLPRRRLPPHGGGRGRRADHGAQGRGRRAALPAAATRTSAPCSRRGPAHATPRSTAPTATRSTAPRRAPQEQMLAKPTAELCATCHPAAANSFGGRSPTTWSSAAWSAPPATTRTPAPAWTASKTTARAKGPACPATPRSGGRSCSRTFRTSSATA